MDLAEKASAGRLATRRLGAAYGRRRWPDVLLTLALTDLLVRLFSNRQPLLLPLRALALSGLRHSAALRRLALVPLTMGPWSAPFGASLPGASILGGVPAFSGSAEPW
jgi:2-octaprenyl-6-methoxyphenol hydroxylase